ncbi:hypothetical protein [Acidovorax sp. SUPP3334]|uniref:hypothetical protein n=1 Tax=Acidovorax sp. SUPP3334 TaxID=2920881 RepID=UPI0023DE1FD9|nr:hypothetical protein [Acidovorax sp. SUPP3334]GKT23492.1 hypothetical protein AVHM3334_11800 [Acidovorax sp. SUPP3334]
MKIIIGKVLGCFIFLLASAKCFSQESDWRFDYKPLDAGYGLYSGELSDPRPAEKSGSSISIKIEKQAAKEIFDQMGSDLPNACPSEAGERMRKNNDLVCYKKRSAQYICYVGIDLKSGKSKIGVIC